MEYPNKETVINTFEYLPDNIRKKVSLKQVSAVLRYENLFYDLEAFSDQAYITFSAVCQYIRTELNYEGIIISLAVVKAILEAEKEYLREIGLMY